MLSSSYYPGSSNSGDDGGNDDNTASNSSLYKTASQQRAPSPRPHSPQHRQRQQLESHDRLYDHPHGGRARNEDFRFRNYQHPSPSAYDRPGRASSSASSASSPSAHIPYSPRERAARLAEEEESLRRNSYVSEDSRAFRIRSESERLHRQSYLDYPEQMPPPPANLGGDCGASSDSFGDKNKQRWHASHFHQSTSQPHNHHQQPSSALLSPESPDELCSGVPSSSYAPSASMGSSMANLNRYLSPPSHKSRSAEYLNPTNLAPHLDQQQRHQTSAAMAAATASAAQSPANYSSAHSGLYGSLQYNPQQQHQRHAVAAAVAAAAAATTSNTASLSSSLHFKSRRFPDPLLPPPPPPPQPPPPPPHCSTTSTRNDYQTTPSCRSPSNPRSKEETDGDYFAPPFPPPPPPLPHFSQATRPPLTTDVLRQHRASRIHTDLKHDIVLIDGRDDGRSPKRSRRSPSGAAEVAEAATSASCTSATTATTAMATAKLTRMPKEEICGNQLTMISGVNSAPAPGQQSKIHTSSSSAPASASAAASPSPSPSPSSLWSPYPVHFTLGSLIQLSNGQLKRVEELSVEDFVRSAESSPEVQISHSIVTFLETNQVAGTGTISFSVGVKKTKVTVEADLEHPFFAFGQGWSSVSPDRTLQRYHLPCQPLRIGNVCISLTHRLSPPYLPPPPPPPLPPASPRRRMTATTSSAASMPPPSSSLATAKSTGSSSSSSKQVLFSDTVVAHSPPPPPPAPSSSPQSEDGSISPLARDPAPANGNKIKLSRQNEGGQEVLDCDLVVSAAATEAAEGADNDAQRSADGSSPPPPPPVSSPELTDGNGDQSREKGGQQQNQPFRRDSLSPPSAAATTSVAHTAKKTAGSTKTLASSSSSIRLSSSLSPTPSCPKNDPKAKSWCDK